ncbi:cell envelope integrity protein TolA [Colwellia sp. MEBiC06753]
MSNKLNTLLVMLKTPLGLSISLHVGLLIFLLFGNFSSEPAKPKMMQVNLNPIQAVTVDKAIIENHAEKIRQEKAKQKAAEQKRLKELEEKAAAAKRKRQQEEARVKKLEQQSKQKEQEKRLADEKAKAAKAKALAEEKARKRKEEERKKAEKAAAEAKKKREREAAERKKKEEAERKRKAQEAKERAAQEKMLAEQMAEEMAARQQARNQQVVSEINRYTALITQTIQRYLITDRSSMEGKSCKLTITLAPSGFVTNVQTGQGSAVVCNAAKNAVYKAGTLPVSKDPEVFREMQKISLTVIPEF